MPLEPLRLKWDWVSENQATTRLTTPRANIEATISFDGGRLVMPWLWTFRIVRDVASERWTENRFTGREPDAITAQQEVTRLAALYAGEPKAAPTAEETAANYTINARTAPQPPPADSEHPAVWPLVFHDMLARHAEGERKYGKPLRPHNGRDALTDAYQEALDLAVYLRQAIFERDGK